MAALAKMMHEKASVDALELAAVTAGPQLVIISQGDVSSEHFSKNGVTKQVHVVVKNLVFVMEVSSSLDLSKCSLEARLLYDFDREEDAKAALEVSYVKNEPLEYKVSLTDGGYKASVELRIKVLTSQHEDMLFRVRLSAADPISGTTFGVISQPIKVISKLTQLKGKSSNPKEVSPSIKKRTTNDMIASTLTEIHRQLQEQNKYIHIIVHKLFSDSMAQQQPPPRQERDNEPLQTLSNIITQHSLGMPSLGEPTDFQTDIPPDQIQVQVPVVPIHQVPVNVQVQQQKPDLEDAFRNFISAFQSLQPEEKQNKLEKLEGFLENVPAEELNDLFDVLESAPLKKKLKLTR